MTSLDKWTDFFRKAGLPREVANTYAHSFTENRIQLSMLPDLNKEYLREMGIFRMGDIILILRQAKTVQERGDTGLGERKRKVSDESEDEKPILKKKLSERMRVDIKPIVRKEVLTEESDDEEPTPVRKKIVKDQQKTTIVLKNSANDREVPQRLSVSNKLIKRTIDTKNSSIFDRLGSKSGDAVQKPTQKPPPVTPASQIKNQRVLLVKKVPAKAVYESSNDSDVTDDESDYMNTSTEKSVSFSAQDEVIEIASQKKGILKKRMNLQHKQQQKQSIRARLGQKSPVSNASQSLAQLRLQKSPRGGKISPITTIKKKPVISSMKSDEILMQQQKKNKSVHERLFNAKINQDKKLSSGIGVGRKVTIKTGISIKNGSPDMKKKQNSGKSVFDRLGFNKR